MSIREGPSVGTCRPAWPLAHRPLPEPQSKTGVCPWSRGSQEPHQPNRLPGTALAKSIGRLCVHEDEVGGLAAIPPQGQLSNDLFLQGKASAGSWRDRGFVLHYIFIFPGGRRRPSLCSIEFGLFSCCEGCARPCVGSEAVKPTQPDAEAQGAL